MDTKTFWQLREIEENVIVNSETMASYQRHADTKVVVDAALLGVDAVLTQKHPTSNFYI